jgi:glycosyltransferase involved in cell wall biosynthesis
VGLFFGFLRPDKNLSGLVEAFALAAPRSVLLVAGNGEHRAAQERVARLGIADRVHWQLRYIEDAEIPDLFAVADWVAVPYAERFTSQSGVLNLAAAYERPLLATPTSSFAEFMTDLDLGVLCNGFTPVAIAEGITQLEQRLAAGAGFQFAAYRAQYSWERNAALTREIYRGLMDRANADG